MKYKLVGIFVCMLLLFVIVTPGIGIMINEENINNKQISLNPKSRHYNTYADDEWSKFRHDLQNTGYSTSLAPQTSRLLWDFQTDFMIETSPVVVDGRVYIGADDHYLYCLNADTGKNIWKYYISDCAEYNGCTVHNGKVYTPVYYGYLYCINADTGTLIWTFNGGSSSVSFVSVTDDKAYFGSGEKIYCLDADTGDELWNYTTDGHISRFSCPAIYDNNIYIGSTTTLYCLYTNNGTKLWDAYLYGINGVLTPAIADGKVYVSGASSYLYCLDAETGDELWDAHISTLSSPTVAYGNVYFTGNRGSYCLNAETGEQIWNSPYGSITYSSPAIADGKFYVGDDNSLFCLDTETGERLWDYKVTTHYLHISPAIAYGRVYMAGTTSGKIYCFEDPSKPPTPPTIAGPTSGVLDQNIEFTISATDPEDSDVEYYVEWGDGRYKDWFGPYKSDKEITITSSWYKTGTYDIRVKARDEDRLVSKWSEPFPITIVEAPVLDIQLFSSKRLFTVNSTIKNVGSLDASDVNWSITVNGGFILGGRETSGVITSIPVGEEIIVDSNSIFGLGKIAITVTAEVANGLPDTIKQKARVLLFIIKVYST